MARSLSLCPRKLQRYFKRANSILDQNNKLKVNKKPFNGVRIMFYDLEVYMALLKPQYVYDLKQPERYIQPSEIEKDKAIMCFAYAFYDNREDVRLHSVLDNVTRFAQDHYDDYELCVKLCEIFEKTDIAVAYNGDRFDWKFFQWRCTVNGLNAPRKPIMFDPFKIVKAEFLATARGLGPIARAWCLNALKGNIPNQKKCAQGDPFSIRNTGFYNIDDIAPMIEIFEFLAFKGYLRKGLSMNAFMNDPDVCITCGVNDFIDDGFEYTKRIKYARIKCKTCNTSQRGERIKP